MDVGSTSNLPQHPFDEAITIMRTECADLRERIVELTSEVEEAKSGAESQVTWIHSQVLSLWESQRETLLKLQVSKEVERDDAQDQSSSNNKLAALLSEVLELLADQSKKSREVETTGSSNDSEAEDVPMSFTGLGQSSSESGSKRAYSAADEDEDDVEIKTKKAKLK